MQWPTHDHFTFTKIVYTRGRGRGQGSRDAAVVRALVFHQCGPGSIPGPDVICGLSLLWVLVLAPRVFLQVLRFSSLHKTNISKFQFDLDVKCLLMSSWLGRLGDCSPHYDVKFDVPFTITISYNQSKSCFIFQTSLKWVIQVLYGL